MASFLFLLCCLNTHLLGFSSGSPSGKHPNATSNNTKPWRHTSRKSSCVVSSHLNGLGLREVRVHCPVDDLGVWARELQVEGDGERGLFSRQQVALPAGGTAGVLVKAFYGHTGLLLQCMVSTDMVEIQEFVTSFKKTPEENGLNITISVASNGQRILDNGNDTNLDSRNVSLEVIDLLSLTDIPKARKQCTQYEQLVLANDQLAQDHLGKDQSAQDPGKKQNQRGNTLADKYNFMSGKLSENSLHINSKKDKRGKKEEEGGKDQLASKVTRRKRFFWAAGTKWCGPGDTAKTYWDLGEERAADVCCREHDHCDRQIPPFSSAYGRYNWRAYTVVDCRCDVRFKICLKAAGTDTANLVGTSYFDLFGPTCFRTFTGWGCLNRSWWGWCYRFGQTQVTHMQRSPSYSQN